MQNLSSVLIALALVIANCSLARAESTTLDLLEAVRLAMQHSPTITQQEQILAQKKGSVQEALGTFDPKLRLNTAFEHDDQPLNPSSQALYRTAHDRKNTLLTSLDLSTATRHGITLGPNLTLQRVAEDIVPQEADNTAFLSFAVNIPLLRGSGRTVVEGPLRAARIDERASLLDLAHVASAAVRDTAKSYWSTLAAQEILRVLTEIEQDSHKLRESTVILVAKDEVPAIRLDTLTADAQSRTADRMRQEHAVLAAGEQLQLSMGQQRTEAVRARGRFPQAYTDLAAEDDILALAMSARRDAAAEHLRSAYYAALVHVYENALLPQLDASAKIGLRGLETDDDAQAYLESTHANTRGPYYSLGLNLTVPFGNNAAKGVLAQYRALDVRQKLRVEQTAQNIRADVRTAYSAVRSAAQRLAVLEESVDHYRVAMTKTQVGFVHGLVTLSDVIDMRDTYRDSMLKLISTQEAYAHALIDLWHASGCAVIVQADQMHIDPNVFFTPPTNPLPAAPAPQDIARIAGDAHD